MRRMNQKRESYATRDSQSLRYTLYLDKIFVFWKTYMQFAVKINEDSKCLLK